MTLEKLVSDAWKHFKELGFIREESTDETEKCAGSCTRCPVPCVPTSMVRMEPKRASKTAIKLPSLARL